LFPIRGHARHDILDSSRDCCKQGAQLLKAPAAEDMFVSSYMSDADARLSDLGILSIERDRFSEIDKRKVLEMLAQRKARKIKILW
jgi:hypothetical protein